MTYSPFDIMVAVDRNGRLRCRILRYDHDAGRDSSLMVTCSSRAELLQLLQGVLPPGRPDLHFLETTACPPSDPPPPPPTFDVRLLGRDGLESD
jgi:hypothetical protein